MVARQRQSSGHLDAGLLAREPQSLTTIYAGLTDAPKLLRRAAQGGSPLARLDLVNVAGGLAFLALILGRVQ
jgi:hypothetical protein